MPFDKNRRLPVNLERENLDDGRVCWFCKHIRFSNADPGYSEYTPGSDFALGCAQGYWQYDQYDDGLDEFRLQLEAAERCADFRDRKP